MFLSHFLDTYINIVAIKMQQKVLFVNIKDEIILVVSKATICRYMKDKTGWSIKDKYLATNQALARRDRECFCKKSYGKSRYSIIHWRGGSS